LVFFRRELSLIKKAPACLCRHLSPHVEIIKLIDESKIKKYLTSIPTITYEKAFFPRSFFRENANDLRFDALIDRKKCYMYMFKRGRTPRTTTRPKKGDLV
jgi:hypothetical protein